RVRGGRLELNPTQGNLLQLAQTLVDELQGDAKRVEITSRGSPEGTFDADRMGAAISNLVGNALQHGAAGTPIKVDIDGTQREWIMLPVSNDGVIPPDVLATIFEPFHSSGPQGRPSGGLGLGLYIVRAFVNAHGGRIDALSDERRGTRFEA